MSLIGVDQKEGADRMPTKADHKRAVGSIKANSKTNRKL